MKIHESINGTVAVLKVRGRMMCGPDVAPLKTQVRSLVRDGIANVVVDLSGVKWVGAAMLGALVEGLKVSRAAGGDLRLSGVTRRISHILTVTKLAGTFHVAETADRAVGSFGGHRDHRRAQNQVPFACKEDHSAQVLLRAKRALQVAAI